MRTRRHPGPGLLRGLAVVAIVLGLAAPASAAPSSVAAPAAFTLRYSGQGWADLVQAGAGQLSCGADAACANPVLAASYVDVDSDPSTVNSSRATVTVPPGSTVDWAGLYWGGDLATRTDGSPIRCEAADPSAPPGTHPADPTAANRVRVAVNSGPYATVTAGSVSSVTGTDGGPAFQAYGDVTAMLRSAPSPVTLTVADLQIAQGSGCAGGWTVVLAYSYPGGPDKTYAPDYRSVAVYDGVLPTPAGAGQPIALAGLTLPATGTVSARLTSAILASGQGVLADGLTLGGTPVPLAGPGASAITGTPGPGYHRATSSTAAGALTARATTATAGLTGARDGYAAAVLGLSSALPVQANLTLTTALDPPEVSVGDAATLTVTLHNNAALADTGVAVTVRVPGGLTIVSTPVGYDAGAGLWTVGTVPPQGTASLAILVRVARAGALDATATISASDLPDPSPAPGALSIVVAPAPTAAPSDPVPPAAAAEPAGWSLPSLPPGIYFGIGIFALGLLALSIVVIRLRSGP